MKTRPTFYIAELRNQTSLFESLGTNIDAARERMKEHGHRYAGTLAMIRLNVIACESSRELLADAATEIFEGLHELARRMKDTTGRVLSRDEAESLMSQLSHALVAMRDAGVPTPAMPTEEQIR